MSVAGSGRHPACRRAGASSPAEINLGHPDGFKQFNDVDSLPAFPGGKDATLYVRQGCLTLRHGRFDYHNCENQRCDSLDTGTLAVRFAPQ